MSLVKDEPAKEKGSQRRIPCKIAPVIIKPAARNKGRGERFRPDGGKDGRCLSHSKRSFQPSEGGKKKNQTTHVGGEKEGEGRGRTSILPVSSQHPLHNKHEEGVEGRAFNDDGRRKGGIDLCGYYWNGKARSFKNRNCERYRNKGGTTEPFSAGSGNTPYLGWGVGVEDGWPLSAAKEFRKEKCTASTGQRNSGPKEEKTSTER